MSKENKRKYIQEYKVKLTRKKKSFLNEKFKR